MSSLFRLPWTHHRRVNQPDTASSSLRTLPSELLLMIALQLPLPDAANFALINRRLSMLIGPTYWPRLRTGAVIPGNREHFLSTLVRDLPSWFYCHSCSYLHPFHRIRLLGPFDERSNSLYCRRAIFDGSLLPYPGGPLPYYSISFHHLQLVMRRHYLGPGYGISTDELSFVHVNELHESELRGRTTALFSVDARVCTKTARLYLRVQRLVLLHTNALELAVERAKCVGVFFHHTAEESEMLQLIVSSLVEHLTRSEGPREPKRRICRRCKFVYQLEVLDTCSDGLAIVITKWLDLGSGLTPLDPKWRFHTDLRPSLRQDDGIDHARDSERCRLEFEKEGGLNQHALTLCNTLRLSKQQYRKTMNKKSAGEWVLQAGQRRNTYDWFAIVFTRCLWGYR